MDLITFKIRNSHTEFELQIPDIHLQQIKDYLEEIYSGDRTHFGYVEENGDEHFFHENLIKGSVITFEFPKPIKVF